MSMKTYSLEVEIDADKIISALLTEFGIEEIAEFIEELVDQAGDQDLLNNVYEIFKRKHAEWLDDVNLDESEYQEHYRDPVHALNDDFDEVEEDPEEENWSTEDDGEENWSTEDLEEENPMDVFTTDD